MQIKLVSLGLVAAAALMAHAAPLVNIDGLNANVNHAITDAANGAVVANAVNDLDAKVASKKRSFDGDEDFVLNMDKEDEPETDVQDELMRRFTMGGGKEGNEDDEPEIDAADGMTRRNEMEEEEEEEEDDDESWEDAADKMMRRGEMEEEEEEKEDAADEMMRRENDEEEKEEDEDSD